ncbi:hypothetical protein WG908_10980 [Sphingobium sp. AN641]|uniref:hypothetical protein n=1 Tax=Sphingobium sp. AN641 TaxID=3133443 RepID=UPI0030C1C782
MTSMDHVFSQPNLVDYGAIGKRRRDPLPQLLRQIMARAGDPCALLRKASRPWCSALFQGRRHVITLHIDGADADARQRALIDGIGEAEWALHGHFVADITIDAVRASDGGTEVELSALTIEEW